MWNYFASILVMGLLAGCSNDTLTGDESDVDLNGSKDAVYMNVSVQLPAGGAARSETDTPDNGDYVTSEDGIEIGKDYENEVKEILLVLAKTDNTFIAAGEALTSMQLKQQNNIVTTTQKISKTTLSTYYGSDGKLTPEEQEINVYVFCNPSQGVKDVIEKAANAQDKKAWINETGLVEEKPNEKQISSIWGGADHKGGFLMSNAVIAKKRLPANFDDWKDYSSESKAFNLSGINNANSDKVIENDGNIKVERSVARFDFKDGSNKNNTYDVVKDADNNLIMQIQLQKMALVNMSKSFYYLRRVSTNGLSDNAQICGVETSTNYVVDTDAQEKKGGIKKTDYEQHFNFCLGHVGDDSQWTIDANARNQWFTSNINDVLESTKDEYNDKEYHIWRYVTENTIPDQDKQTNGISTGIVFKGKMIAPENANGTLAKALNEATGDSDTDPILYTYLTNIYVTWKEVRAAAINAGENSNFYMATFGETNRKPVAEKAAAGENPAVEAVYSDDINSPDYLWNIWHNEKNAQDATALKEFKKAATGEKFTLYQSSQDGDDAGYYCYYFYWNRHNDNGKSGEMGPMEFGVVRNNVYKLAVTDINRLGHPRISENDPDPVYPDDPDEKDDVYLTLSVEVLPWVVRINNIEF